MRFNSGFRRVAMTAAALLLTMGGMSAASAALAAPAPPTAACIVRITEYAFSPGTAVEGDHTVLKLRVRNCTDTEQDVTVTQYGLQPPGCPVMDPVGRPVAIAAKAVFRSRSRMVAPPCAGTESMTVNITGATGAPLASATAKLTVTA